MAQVFDGIDDALRAWVEKQHIFFVSTAPLDADGLVNCSPKGYESFRILNDREVAYLDLTGSGIETVAHLKENGRIVFMFCSFDRAPRIVRFHGKGTVYERGTPEFDKLLEHFEPHCSMRSIIHVRVTRVSDSCGYGVPRYEYLGARDTLLDYWDKRGESENLAYRRTQNATSLDGLPALACQEAR